MALPATDRDSFFVDSTAVSVARSDSTLDVRGVNFGLHGRHTLPEDGLRQYSRDGRAVCACTVPLS
jgi:hypothetical protein